MSFKEINTTEQSIKTYRHKERKNTERKQARKKQVSFVLIQICPCEIQLAAYGLNINFVSGLNRHKALVYQI